MGNNGLILFINLHDENIHNKMHQNKMTLFFLIDNLKRDLQPKACFCDIAIISKLSWLPCNVYPHAPNQ